MAYFRQPSPTLLWKDIFHFSKTKGLYLKLCYWYIKQFKKSFNILILLFSDELICRKWKRNCREKTNWRKQFQRRCWECINPRFVLHRLSPPDHKGKDFLVNHYFCLSCIWIVLLHISLPWLDRKPSSDNNCNSSLPSKEGNLYFGKFQFIEICRKKLLKYSSDQLKQQNTWLLCINLT